MPLLDTAQAFALVGLAELGDKSQLVCLALAARHGAVPITIGALLAFGLLNGVACVVGAGVAGALPELWVHSAAALLFAFFGVKTLLEGEEADKEEEISAVGNPILLTFSMLVLAELGDKTQITVLGLASAGAPAATWLGATVALTLTSAVAAWAGRWLNDRLPKRTLHRVTGALFLVFAVAMVA